MQTLKRKSHIGGKGTFSILALNVCGKYCGVLLDRLVHRLNIRLLKSAFLQTLKLLNTANTERRSICCVTNSCKLPLKISIKMGMSLYARH